jgi:hypothetical protein
MADGELFYQYRNLKVAVDNDCKTIKDDNGNDVIYTIENLANNQLYFSDPTTFNDPFDCKFLLDHTGTREQWIDDYKSLGNNHRKALKAFNEDVKNGFFEKNGDLYSYNPIKVIKNSIKKGLCRREEFLVYSDPRRKSRKQIGIDMNDYIRDMKLLGVSCFSGRDDSILMWSHYADYHQGICLRFRSYKIRCERNGSVDDVLIDLGLMIEGRDYYLSKLYPPRTLILTNNILYDVDYKDDLPESVNYFDKSRGIKMYKFLLSKFTDWQYENEYRIIIPDFMLENGLLKYKKEDLEGIIFGLKINHENAKLVYDTVKKNYLDEGVTVNFYEAIEVPHKYNVEIKQIDDVEKYLNDLF